MSEIADEPLRQPRSCTHLFLAFTRLALQGFGGVIAIAQHELVERERWLSRDEFLEMLSVSQVLPGPNVVNLSLMVGDRFFGWRGACASLGGMLLAPLALMLVLAAVYGQFSHNPRVSGALRGMGAVSAGLVLATAWKLLTSLHRNPLGLPICLGIGAVTVVLIVVLKWPLAGVLALLGAGSTVWVWKKLAP